MSLTERCSSTLFLPPPILYETFGFIGVENNRFKYESTAMRVLLADDQSHIRSALQLLLKYEPAVYVVGEASDAKSLLAQLRAIHPDAILLDWELPGLIAIDTLTALREDCPHLSVIALSGQPEARQEALDSGADAFVSKIEPPEQLLAVLHALNSKQKVLKLIGGRDNG